MKFNARPLVTLLTIAGIVTFEIGTGGLLALASPSGYAPHGTVTIDGMTVPDIGPLPTSIPTPSTNLNYKAKIDLGKQLYFDGRLSKSGAISCAFCHNPGTGFADPRQTSIGIGGGVGGRQSPTVYNTAFNHVQFWDGRARSLEEQAIGPIQNPIEMGETHENVVSKLKKLKGYQQQFRAVFGTEGLPRRSPPMSARSFQRIPPSTSMLPVTPKPWMKARCEVWPCSKGRLAASSVTTGRTSPTINSIIWGFLKWDR
jgi:cytochrome c peroxidase